jgi:peptidoglycan-N-acetylglucosamine deacetylase
MSIYNILRELIENIMSVDLEDYYCDLPFSTWNRYESRVVKNTKVILELFEKYHIRGTFFTLGYIAEKYPDLIEEIKSKGHEIASHGYSHTDIRKMTKDSFESDLIKSLEILEKTCGEKILGFRAPYFSIVSSNFWAFDIIRRHFVYDSSVFPVRTPLYGIPDAPRHIYRMSQADPLKADENSEFLELPLATLKIPLIGNIPVAGGFHLRFWPYILVKLGIKQLNKAQYPGIFYIHPRDLDPATPRLPEYAWHYYWSLGSAIKKFESILKNFKFSPVREVIR